MDQDKERTYLETLKRAYGRIVELEAERDRLARAAGAPVAIIGAALRFPGAPEGLDSFWALLRSGRDPVREPPPGRFAGRPSGAPHLLAGYLEDIDRFDNRFFGIPAEETVHMDPQQRLLLEASLDAMFHAGLDVTALAGRRVGVYAGLAKNRYEDLAGGLSIFSATSGQVSCAAGRIAFHFGLRGPCMSLDTACSSSLAAAHLAVRALRQGECELALVGGVNLILSSEGHEGFGLLGLLAPDGRSKSFDDAADGFGRGEGVAVAVLKRLDDALRDGDRVLAVIRGSAMNHDGFSAGLTAPNQQAQVEVIRLALAEAGLEPRDVDFVETHGTGTQLGDTIEARALQEAYGRFRTGGDKLVLGAVKAVFGHLEYAAGMAGLLKAALCLCHEEIPAQPRFGKPNRHLPWDEFGLAVADTARPWRRGAKPRRAGVSGFGISGTNVHLILEEAPAVAARPVPADGGVHLLALSARGEEALRAQAAAVHNLLRGDDAPPPADLCAMAALRRPHFGHRLALAAEGREEVLDALAAAASGQPSPAVATGFTAEPARTVFVFAGQGSQWPGMGRALLETSAVFRETVARVEAAFAPHVDWSLRDVLASEAAELHRVDVVQPALFAMQLGLAAVWRDLGVTPDAVVGQSMGEAAAACVAGALSLEDAARVICRRSRVLADAALGGAMAMVELDEAEAAGLCAGISDSLVVAVYNAPGSLVISGEPEAVDAVVRRVAAMGRFAGRVQVDYASHSAFMEPILGAVEQALAGIAPRRAALPFFSTVDAAFLDGSELDAAYFARNLRRPVRFAQAVAALLGEGYGLFIELSPHPVVLHHLRSIAGQARRPAAAVPTLLRGRGDRRTLLTHLGQVYAAGGPVDWRAVYPGAPAFVELPGYPWQRHRFWLEPQAQPEVAGTLDGEAVRLLHAVAWTPRPLAETERLAAARAVPGTTLLLADRSGVADALAGALRRAGEAVVLARRGDGFGREGPEAWVLGDARGDLSRLAAALPRKPDRVILLWPLDESGGDPLDAGFWTVLSLLRAWDEPPAELVVAARHATHAGGTAPRCPEDSALFALVRAAAGEYAATRFRCLDLDAAVAAEALAVELRLPEAPLAVAFRGGERLVERLVPFEPGSRIRAPLAFDAAGAHVITGGTGGIGLETAAFLAARGARGLALIGRTEPPPRADWDRLAAAEPESRWGRVAVRLHALEAAGVRVSLHRADVADRAELARALDAVRDEHGAIAGLVHGAGVASDKLLAEMDEDAVRAVLAPKLLGARHLLELTGGDAPAYVLFHSSATSLFKAAAQAPYAAANAYLDALARRLEADGRRACSVAWPIWKETGMAARGGFAVDTAFKALPTAAGLAALEALLAVKAPHAVVGEPNLDPAMAQVLLDAPFALADGLRRRLETAAARAEGTGSAAGDGTLVLSGRADGAYTEPERLLGQVYGALLGYTTLNVHDNFFALGGNSILATRIVNRLRSVRPELKATVADVLRHLTIAGLAAELERRQGRGGDLPEIVAVPAADAYPASHEQKRFWLQDQTEEDATLYNLTGSFLLEGALDEAALERAFAHLVERHEPLRTTFALREGELVQVVGREAAFVLERADLRARPDAEAAARAFVLAESRRPFDLERGPLLRGALLFVPPQADGPPGGCSA